MLFVTKCTSEWGKLEQSCKLAYKMLKVSVSLKSYKEYFHNKIRPHIFLQAIKEVFCKCPFHLYVIAVPGGSNDDLRLVWSVLNGETRTKCSKFSSTICTSTASFLIA